MKNYQQYFQHASRKLYGFLTTLVVLILFIKLVFMAKPYGHGRLTGIWTKLNLYRPHYIQALQGHVS